MSKKFRVLACPINTDSFVLAEDIDTDFLDNKEMVDRYKKAMQEKDQTIDPDNDSLIVFLGDEVQGEIMVYNYHYSQEVRDQKSKETEQWLKNADTSHIREKSFEELERRDKEYWSQKGKE